MSDRYLFNDGEIYEIQSEADFTEFRDGNPFTYPAVVLKNVYGDKTKICPKFSLDRLAKRIPHPINTVDSFEVFVDFFEKATNGKFTETINSFSSEEYALYKEASKKLQPGISGE